MTLDFFYKNYDLTDLEIKSAAIKNNRLVIDVLVVAKLELIANGYRPEMDVEHEIEFSFGYNSPDKKLEKPVITKVDYNDNGMDITLNNVIYNITENQIFVTQRG
ncbi:MAG: hypothetical protein K6A63_07110 [Acholeplasmatales bacterium]|nr:hypothetical protein [Acholeplasmatales bacterium]